MIKFKYKNLRCKICDNSTSVLGVVDFSKTCEEINKKTVFAPIGFPVYYHQCNFCKFIFTIDFDDWTIQDFIDNIYNDDYILADPEYSDIRPKNLSKWILPLLNDNKDLTILDYGAGTGIFGKELQKLGFNVKSYDSLWQADPDQVKDTKFDIVTAFEVLEHSPTQWDTAKEIIEFSKTGEGEIIIQTLSNDIIQKEGVNYWYIAPRNGHVCMHSNKSLEILFGKLGLDVFHLAPNTHVLSWKE